MTRAKKSFLTLIGAAMLVAAVPSADAQAQSMRCGDRESVIDRLQTKYGEVQRSVGLQQGRGIVEIFANPRSGSWTIIITTPEGKSCLMAAGEAFHMLEATAFETPA